MKTVLEEVQYRLLAKDWSKLTEFCRTRWECPYESVADLLESLTNQGFLKVFGALEEIRRESRDKRASLVSGLGFVIDIFPSELEEQKRARKAIEVILLHLPSSPGVGSLVHEQER